MPIGPRMPPISIEVARPSFHLRPAARLETTVPAPAEIAPTIAPPMTITARPVPNVAATNAASAMKTTRLTQKPGSVSSCVTNLNAALSLSTTQSAALTIAPQRPPGFFGSFCASALTLAWPWETFDWLSPGIFWVPESTLAAWASISVLVWLIPPWSLLRTLPTEALTLPVYWLTVRSPVALAEVRGAVDLRADVAGDRVRAGARLAGGARGAGRRAAADVPDAAVGALGGAAGGLRDLLGGLAAGDDPGGADLAELLVDVAGDLGRAVAGDRGVADVGFRSCAAVPCRALVACACCFWTAWWPTFAPWLRAAFVVETVPAIWLVAAPCCALSDLLACAWTEASALWPELTPFWTAVVACLAIAVIDWTAPGSVDLIAVAPSLPFASKAGPILAPSLATPCTTGAPCERTLPDVSPETLEATFASPSCAAWLGPPPLLPACPCTDPAVLLIVPWTLDCVALTADLPWAANCEPTCVDSFAASLTALCVFVLALLCHEVTVECAVVPALVTVDFAAPTAALRVPWALAIALLTAPWPVVPAALTSRDCLATAFEIAPAVRVAAAFRRAPRP